MKKVNISLDDELLSRVDIFCDKNYMSRSGFFSFISAQYLNQYDLIFAINSMANTLKRFENGEIKDDGLKEQLAEFSLISKRFLETQTPYR